MYPWLPLADITPAIPVMAALGVSEVARSPRGFLTAYQRARGNREILSATLAPGVSRTWAGMRHAFIQRHMAQVDALDDLWDAEGNPTRRALALVAWAYHPEPQKWRAWLRRADLT
jgi:hypothetical protein